MPANADAQIGLAVVIAATDPNAEPSDRDLGSDPRTIGGRELPSPLRAITTPVPPRKGDERSLHGRGHHLIIQKKARITRPRMQSASPRSRCSSRSGQMGTETSFVPLL